MKQVPYWRAPFVIGCLVLLGALLFQLHPTQKAFHILVAILAVQFAVPLLMPFQRPFAVLCAAYCALTVGYFVQQHFAVTHDPKYQSDRFGLDWLLIIASNLAFILGTLLRALLRFAHDRAASNIEAREVRTLEA